MGGFRPSNLVHLPPVTIGVASSQAIAANDNRSYLLLVNDSNAVIYINVTGGTAVLNEGIRLNAAGGNYEMSARNGNLDPRAVNAITTDAGKNLLLTEGEEG